MSAKPGETPNDTTRQAPEPLAAWVQQQLAPGARVAWLGASAAGASQLQAVGWSALHLPPDTGSLVAPLRALAPDAVVLEGAQGATALEAQVREVLEAAPRARLLLEVHNASCAASLLEALVSGSSAAPGVTARELELLAARVGAAVRERHAVPAPAPVLGLARATGSALHGLLGQVAPETQVGRWRCVLVRDEDAGAARAPAAPPVPGLLSVVVRADEPVPGPQGDEALFALACQEYLPLEVVVAGEAPDGWREVLERYRSVGGFTLRIVEGSVADGVRHARGQYLALLSPACVVYPGHYAQLIELLRSGESAWAVARARHARVREGAARYIESKLPVPLGEVLGLAHLREEPALHSAFVVDRARLGPFALEDGEPGLDTLPLRLAALFEPCFAGGIATLEARVDAASPQQAGAPPVPELQALRSLPALAALEQGGAGAPAAAGLRHQLLDELNQRLLHRAPAVHARLKRWARGWVRRSAAERGNV